MVIYNLPLKFGSKRSTLKFWVFGPRAQFLACLPLELKITLDKNSNGFWKFGKFIWDPIEEINNTHKSFWKRKILVFQPNFCQNSVFAKIEAKFFWYSEKKVARKSIRDIKTWIFSAKYLPSPIPTNLLLQKLTTLNSNSRSSQNPSPGKTSQASALLDCWRLKVRWRCARVP